MVAVLVRLRLSILRQALRASVWRLVGVILGSLYALYVVGLGIVGQVALRVGAPEYAGPASVVAFSLISLGWLLLPILYTGVDDTLSPSRFALLPLSGRALAPGLLAASFVGLPGIATTLLALGQFAIWSTSAPALLAALVCVPVGLVTAVISSRVVTATFARSLASRRYREATTLVLTLMLSLSGIAIGKTVDLLQSRARSGSGSMLQTLETAARVLGWTPLGWAWATPGDAAAGEWGSAALRFALALGALGLAWWGWVRGLDRALVEPVEASASHSRVLGHGVLDRITGSTPAGAVAGRCLRYWRRDPRFLTSAVMMLALPVLLVLAPSIGSGANQGGGQGVGFLAPALLGLIVANTISQDLSYDGTALWTHVTAAIRGVDDRRGRVRALLLLVLPICAFTLVVLVLLTGRTDLVLPALAGGLATILAGAGVGSWVGAYFQVPVPPPGANPFQVNSGGGVQGLIAFGLTSGATAVVALPALALAVASAVANNVSLSVLALGVGLVLGGAAVVVGTAKGGAALDRRWSEVLSAVAVER